MPSPSALDADEVHVWRASLDLDGTTLERLQATLSADERARAERFHFSKHRAHFIVGRGLLRHLLGKYLAIAPAELRFTFNPQGKPALEGVSLRFNLAHSHGLAVYAVTRQREVGVDVERVRSEVAGEGIAERFFSPREVATLRALPVEQRLRAFFHCWTRKEAYVKAVGKGLMLPLDSFDVSLTPDVPALLEVRGEATDEKCWTMRELDVPAGYIGALAGEGDGWRLWCGDLLV
jgi:4'-phosphopantetheinyl transferase